jgi:hypothetical protein
MSWSQQSPPNRDGQQFHQYLQNQQSPFVDIGRIVDHLCLEVIVGFVDIGRIVDHLCLEVIVGFVDIGGIVDHLCLEVIVGFVDIGGIVKEKKGVSIKLPNTMGLYYLGFVL